MNHLFLFAVLVVGALGQLSADVGVSKSGPETMVIGSTSPFQYQINIANAGPTDSFDVTMTDVIPFQFNISSVRASYSNGTIVCEPVSGQTVRCTVIRLRVGDVARVFVNVTLPSNVLPFQANNTACVTATTPDPDPANNCNSRINPVTTVADLAIEIQGLPTAKAGQPDPISYSVRVTNNGESDARNVVARFNVVSPLVFASFRVTDPSVTCRFDAALSQVICTRDVLVRDGSFTFQVFETVPANALSPNGGTINMTAVVSSDTFDNQPLNNIASISLFIEVLTDVSVTKGSIPLVVAGQPDTQLFTIVVENAGPSTAISVEMKDQIPEPFVLKNATIVCNVTPQQKRAGHKRFEKVDFASHDLVLREGVPCSSALSCEQRLPNFLVCSISVLQTFERVRILVFVGIPAGAFPVNGRFPWNITNTAFVDSLTKDNNQARNSDPADVEIIINSDVAVTKTGPTSIIISGDGKKYEYIVTATNQGPSTAHGVSIYDEIPTYAVTLNGTVTVVTGSASCTLTPIIRDSLSYTALNCSAGDLNVGQSVVLSIPFSVGPNLATQRVPNTACASVFLNDTNLSNNCGNWAILIQQAPDVGVNKTGPNSVTVGVDQIYKYTITVYNLGPSTALNARLIDVVPPPFIVIATPVPSQGFCIPNVTNPNYIDCDLGTLAVPSEVIVTIDFRIPNNTTIPFASNNAFVFSDTPDRNPSNNNATFPTIIIRIADLRTQKTGPPELCAGEGAGVYSVIVTNNGPSEALNTRLVDDLPNELVPGTVLSIVGAQAGAQCSFSGQRLTCSLGTMARNQVITISYTASVLASTPANPAGVRNTAVSSSDTPDDVPANNQASYVTPICARADLAILKAGPISVNAGEPNQHLYTVSVTNLGPADAVNVRVWDAFPSQFTPVGTPSDPNCNYAVLGGQTWMNCTFARLTPGASRSVVFPFTVAANVPAQTVQNCAETASNTFDPNLSNNRNCTNTQVVVRSDLSILKEGPGSICAGDFPPDSFFTVTVTNLGPAVATGVTVTDPLNPVFTPGPSSAIVPAGVCTYVNGNQLSCSIGSLNVNQSFVIRYPVHVAADVPAQTSVLNTATVSSLTTDGNQANNNSTASTLICAQADMTVLKTGPAVASAGVGEYEYTIRVTNLGYSVGRNVYFEDAVPSVFQVIGTPTGTAGVTCQVIAAPQTYRCSWPAAKTFAVGESQTVTIRFRVPDNTLARSYDNCATVFNSVPDPNLGNNVNCTSTQVNVSTDVSIVKNGPATLCAGGPSGEYTLTVRNNGPAVANEVKVNDTIDSRFQPVAGSVTPSQCSFTGQLLSCTLGTLQVGQQIVIRYSVRVPDNVPAQNNVENVAFVSSTTPDGNSQNDFSRIFINICAEADLAVRKTAPPTAVAGDGVVYNYQMTIQNNGPAVSVNAVLRDTLPSLFTAPAIGNVVVNGGGSCTYTNAPNTLPVLLECVWPQIAVGANFSVTVPFTVGPAVPPGSVENCAVVFSSTTSDPVQSNNRDCATTVVQVQTDVQIRKSGPNRVCAGDGITYLYTVVIVNRGPSVAQAVTISDTIPTQLTGLSTPLPVISPAGAATCTYVSGTLACNVVGGLPRDNEISVTFPFNVAASQSATTVVNRARVTTTSSEFNTNNNEATFQTEICAQADLRIVKEGPATVVAGDRNLQQFRLSVSNLGQAWAYNVTVTDASIPTAFFNVQNVTSAAGASCSLSVAGGFATVSCFYPVFRLTDTDTITINFFVPSSATPGPRENCATIGSAVTQDPNPANNRDCITVTIRAQADLRTTKVGPASVTAGVQSPLNAYRVSVKNIGGSDALDSKLVDTVPFDFKVTTATPSKGTCSVGSDNVVRCNFGTLLPEEEVFVDYAFTVAPGISLETRTNNACASTTTDESNLNNNCAIVQTTVRCEAALRISKTDGVERVIAGNTTVQTFVITVTNVGPSVSRDTVVTDTWPVEYTRVGEPVPSTGRCEVTGTGFFCNFGTLAVNQTVTVQVSYTVGAGVRSPSATNTACAQTSCGVAQVCASDTNTISQIADLFVVKDDCVSNVTAGSTAETVFTITARNLGPSDAVNFTLSDTWPIQYIQGRLTTSPNGAVCRNLGGSFSCNWPTLPVGVTVQVTVAYTVASTTPEQYVTNCAQVTSNTPDSNPLNNEDCDTNLIIALADLEVTKKIDNNDCVVAGSPDIRRYTVVVTNKGPSTAYNVVLRDFFPADLIVVGPPDCTVSNGVNYTCNLNTLELGATRTLVWSFRVDASRVPGLIENRVNVQSTTRDPELCNNNATVCSIICAQSDLSVTKTDNQVEVTAGSPNTFTYTIVGTNAGPSWARNVTFVDTWPREFTRTGISAPGGIVTELPDGGFTVLFPLLRVGEQYTIRVNYTVDACVLACKACNAVVISSPYEDPNPRNNRAEDCTDIRTEANLEVCKSDNRVEVTAGEGSNIQYTIQVANNGPSCAQKVSLTDHFPSAVRQVAGSILTSQGVCVSSPAPSQDFECALLTLRPGQVVTVYVNYTVPSTASACSVCNYVTVSSITFDPELCNNDAKDCNALVTKATLSISKTDGQTVISGSDLRPYTYTITVGNNGPSRATDVVLTDRWPAGFIQFSNTLHTSKGLCVSQAKRDFTCSLGDLEVGQTTTVTVSYNNMQPPMCGVVTNAATVFSPTDVSCRETVDNTTVQCNSARAVQQQQQREVEMEPLVAVPMVATKAEIPLAAAFVPRAHKGAVLSPRLLSVELSGTRRDLEVTVKNTFMRPAEIESVTMQLTNKAGKIVGVDLAQKSELFESDCGVALGRSLQKGWSVSCKITLKTADVAEIKVDVRGAAEVANGFHPMMGTATF